MLPRPRTTSVWDERWRSGDDRLSTLDLAIRRACPAVHHGGDYDRWDLQVRGGALGVVRIRMGVEEHGCGRQLVRFRSWPVPSRAALVLGATLGVLAVLATADGAILAAATLSLMGLAIVVACGLDCAFATGALFEALTCDVDAGGAVVMKGHERELGRTDRRREDGGCTRRERPAELAGEYR